MQNDRIKGLDALRAIASLVVLLSHIELLKGVNGMPCISSQAIHGIAHTAVILFFVISGYLITLLLLQERSAIEKIDIKHFYLKRIVRIWPLYYLILLLSCLFFSYQPSSTSLVLCLAILPNIAYVIGHQWLASPQIWSIGVEEQFYLAWPWLLKIPVARLFKVLLFIAIAYTLLPHVLLFLLNNYSQNGMQFAPLINHFFFTAKFNCMAMGGLVACLQFSNAKFIRWVALKKYALLFIALPFIAWFTNAQFFYFTDEVMAALFCLLIITLTHNYFYLFNNSIMSFTGRISYGIYMYHWMVISVMILFFKNCNGIGDTVKNIGIYVFSIAFTILISFLSHISIEKYFLKFKNRPS